MRLGNFISYFWDILGQFFNSSWLCCQGPWIHFSEMEFLVFSASSTAARSQDWDHSSGPKRFLVGRRVMTSHDGSWRVYVALRTCEDSSWNEFRPLRRLRSATGVKKTRRCAPWHRGIPCHRGSRTLPRPEQQVPSPEPSAGQVQRGVKPLRQVQPLESSQSQLPCFIFYESSVMFVEFCQGCSNSTQDQWLREAPRWNKGCAAHKAVRHCAPLPLMHCSASCGRYFLRSSSDSDLKCATDWRCLERRLNFPTRYKCRGLLKEKCAQRTVPARKSWKALHTGHKFTLRQWSHIWPKGA